MQANTQIRNQWHDRTGTNPQRLGTIYGTPRGWHAKSLQSANLDDIQDLSIQNNIRAAAIFPRGIDVKKLVHDTSWCLIVNWPPKDWTILIASPPDAETWIEEAYAHGAITWYIDDAAPVFVYNPMKHSDPFIDLQDPNFDPDTIDTVSNLQYGPGNINYDIVHQDLRNGYLNAVQIAAKHGVSKTLIYNIKQVMNGTREAKPRVYPRIDQDAAIADIKSGLYSRVEICQLYKIKMNQLTYFQNKFNLNQYFKKSSRPGQYIKRIRRMPK